LQPEEGKSITKNDAKRGDNGFKTRRGRMRAHPAKGRGGRRQGKESGKTIVIRQGGLDWKIKADWRERWGKKKKNL